MGRGVQKECWLLHPAEGNHHGSDSSLSRLCKSRASLSLLAKAGVAESWNYPVSETAGFDGNFRIWCRSCLTSWKQTVAFAESCVLREMTLSAPAWIDCCQMRLETVQWHLLGFVCGTKPAIIQHMLGVHAGDQSVLWAVSLIGDEGVHL